LPWPSPPYPRPRQPAGGAPATARRAHGPLKSDPPLKSNPALKSDPPPKSMLPSEMPLLRHPNLRAVHPHSNATSQGTLERTVSPCTYKPRLSWHGKGMS
jgi:hypothetical protein